MTENNDLIRIFENDQFGNVRVVIRDDEPWFVAADVCRALNIAQVTNTIRRLDDDEKALISVKGISRGNDQVSIVIVSFLAAAKQKPNFLRDGLRMK